MNRILVVIYFKFGFVIEIIRIAISDENSTLLQFGFIILFR